MMFAKKQTKPSDGLASKVTQAELDALGATPNPLLHGGVDRYFKWRHAFLSVMVVVFVIRLVFFHDQVLNLSVIFNNLGIDTQKYLSLRSLYLITGAAMYVVSYVRNWFFPQISMVAFALALGGLVTDTLNFFAFYQGAFPQGVVFVVFLRSSVVVCMFYNAIYAHRAPPMPRHFWS
jgi:hypothetical protein